MSFSQNYLSLCATVGDSATFSLTQRSLSCASPSLLEKLQMLIQVLLAVGKDPRQRGVHADDGNALALVLRIVQSPNEGEAQQ